MNGEPLPETLGERRNRLLREGKAIARHVADECVEELYNGEAHSRLVVSAAVRRACEASYERGIETMGDIALPQVATADLAAAEAREEAGRDAAILARLRALPANTTALAINAVVRRLVEVNSAQTIQRWPARAEMPVEEAAALCAVAEAALGTNTAALVESGLFPTLP